MNIYFQTRPFIDKGGWIYDAGISLGQQDRIKIGCLPALLLDLNIFRSRATSIRGLQKLNKEYFENTISIS